MMKNASVMNMRKAQACAASRICLVIDAAVLLVVSICVAILRIMVQFM